MDYHPTTSSSRALHSIIIRPDSGNTESQDHGGELTAKHIAKEGLHAATGRFLCVFSQGSRPLAFRGNPMTDKLPIVTPSAIIVPKTFHPYIPSLSPQAPLDRHSQSPILPPIHDPHAQIHPTTHCPVLVFGLIALSFVAAVAGSDWCRGWYFIPSALSEYDVAAETAEGRFLLDTASCLTPTQVAAGRFRDCSRSS